MKAKFSNSWIASRQVRKQRKYRFNAPLHIKHKFLSANLSKDLRKDHGKRNIPVRKGDEVLIMRGKFNKKKGKILIIDLKKERVTVDGVTRSKKDGTKIEVWHNPSNLQIISLNKEDSKRLKSNSKNQKTETKEKENASEKN